MCFTRQNNNLISNVLSMPGNQTYHGFSGNITKQQNSICHKRNEMYVMYNITKGYTVFDA